MYGFVHEKKKKLMMCVCVCVWMMMMYGTDLMEQRWGCYSAALKAEKKNKRNKTHKKKTTTKRKVF
jgi:hypothetical protein